MLQRFIPYISQIDKLSQRMTCRIVSCIDVVTLTEIPGNAIVFTNSCYTLDLSPYCSLNNILFGAEKKVFSFPLYSDVLTNYSATVNIGHCETSKRCTICCVCLKHTVVYSYSVMIYRSWMSARERMKEIRK